MSFQAGFSELDITPEYFPVRTYFSSANEILDPLYVHAAAFSSAGKIIVFISFDVVIVEWEYVERIRKGIAAQRSIPEANIMVCATHNHACPAVVDRPGSDKDEQYINFMVKQGVQAGINAIDKLKDAEVGVGRGFEAGISFNRRYIKTDGSVVSQPTINRNSNDILYGEGIIDPGVGVLSVKDHMGHIMGIMVNFSCHAVHHMGELSAGFPGVLCDKIKQKFGAECACVFLNGACGNVIHRNYSDPGSIDTKEKSGEILADDVIDIMSRIEYFQDAEIDSAETIADIKYRDITGLEQNIDNLRPFNVFEGLITKGWYRYSLDKLKKLHSISDHEKAVIQVFRIGDTFFGSAPCEYFSQHALRIKEESPGDNTFVVSLANGWLGYIPHKEAFKRRGGHESTWAIWSKMEPDAGGIIADNILNLIEGLNK
jgi:hypothetical protein